MIVISSAEANANWNKYMDLAMTEKVMVEEEDGKTYDLGERYIRRAPDEDLARAIPGDEFLEMVLSDIRRMYKLPR